MAQRTAEATLSAPNHDPAEPSGDPDAAAGSPRRATRLSELSALLPADVFGGLLSDHVAFTPLIQQRYFDELFSKTVAPLQEQISSIVADMTAPTLFKQHLESFRLLDSEAFNAQVDLFRATWTEQLAELLDSTIATYQAQLPSLMETAWSLIEEITDTFDALDEALEKLLPMFSVAGFWIAPSMRLTLLHAFRAHHEAGTLTPELMRELIVESYRADDHALLRETVASWATDPIFAPRMHIINDALDAHVEGRYTLSIPALLPQIEGIASEIAKQPPGKSGPLVKQAIDLGYPPEQGAVFRNALVAYTAERAYSSVDFATFNSWLAERGLTPDQVLHRHAILHGVQVGYASEENSLRAFLLLDALSHIAQLPI